MPTGTALLLIMQVASTPAGEERERATPVVAEKLVAAPSFELGASYVHSFADKYIEHTGVRTALTLHLADHFAVTAHAGYLFGDATDIYEKVRSARRTLANPILPPDACATPTCEPELPDQWQTTWFGGAGVQWAPLYGKLSLGGDVELGLQAFGEVGIGLEGIRRELRDLTYVEPLLPRPAATWGVGARLFPWSFLALHGGVRGRAALNPPVPEVGESGEDPCPDGYALSAGGVEQCQVDVSHTALLEVGAGFVF